MRQEVIKNLKPLWIILSTRWGGPEQVAISDLSDFGHAGIPISLICLKDTPVHAAALRHPNIKVITLDEHPYRWIDWGFVRFLKHTLDESQANIIHINNERLLRHLAPAIWGRPHVSLVSSRYAFREASFKDVIQAPLFRRLDYMIVLNEQLRGAVLNTLPLNRKKVKVINIGLDFARFDPEKTNGKVLRKEWGADSDTIVIGSVGRLVPEVGQDTFLKAAAGLMKYKNRKLLFVLVAEEPLGVSDDYMSELQDLVTLFHMQPQVRIVSLSDNLPETMAAFDLFVMPGREEVPGLGALEALAMERAVVLSNVVGAMDIVGHRNEYGLLVRPEDAYDLQQKILGLLEDPSLRISMGVQGRKYVLKNFDKKIRFNKTLDVYERCLKRRFSRRDRR